MNITKKKIASRDLWRLVDEAFRLMHPELHHHHQMVGYLSYRMAKEAGLSSIMQYLTLQAAYLHDIGAVIEGEGLTLLDIEEAGFQAAQISANLLEDFPDFITIASIVRHSQTAYRTTRKMDLPALQLPGPLQTISRKLPKLSSPLIAADIIHLADDVSLMIRKDLPVLNQVEEILETAREKSGDEYAPEAVAALEKLQFTEQVWLDLAYYPERVFEIAIKDDTVGIDQALQISWLISVIIDFRSPFTAMHSAGVAASACALARYAGMNEQECRMMELAGNLHDLGKIRTPQAILEKPGKLTAEEFNVIKEHAYFTDLLLSNVEGFEVIAKWASLHHEKLNGTGYPYHLTEDQIPFGSKIMAVSDVFSAITEERPYRKGMPEEKVKGILRENAEKGELCPVLVELLIAHFEEINDAREKASRQAGQRYYRSLKKEAKG